MKLTQHMTKARAQLVMQHPFFASIVLSIPIDVDEKCPTMWTNGLRMGYKPAWFDALTLPEAVGVLAHETMHIVAMHHVRQQSRNARKWNIAADFVINALLLQQGFTLPETQLINLQYANNTVEEVYALLLDSPDDDDDDDGDGDGDGDGDEKSDNDPGGCGEVRAAGRSPVDIKRVEEDTKILVQQALNAAKMMGNVPAGIERLVGELMEPQVDWRDYTRDFAKQIAKDDYSWLYPNRRHIAANVYLPVLRSERVGAICLFLDTSGSVGQKELDAFASELNGVLHQVMPSEVITLYVDAEVVHVERFKAEDWPVKLHPKGGGGTDFRPPFVWVDEHLEQPPECAIYLTDMCGTFPAAAPNYPVLWLSTSKDIKAPWGQTMYLKT